MRRVLVVVAVFVLLATIMPVLAEPSLEAVLDSLGFTNRTLVSVETFPKGTYNVTLYAEWAGYRDQNKLRWYKVGTSDFNLIFDGPEGIPPGDPMGMLVPPYPTKSFASDDTFGLSMLSPDGIEYSEQSRNDDGKQHVRIYQSGTDPNLYYIGFENKYPGSDFDFNDMVFSLHCVKAYLTVTSPYDSPNPTSGWFDVGTDIMASVSSPVLGGVGTRYACIGWSGTGSVPAMGSGTAVSFTITQDSSLAWNWKTQYLLTVATEPLGLIPPPSRNPLGEAGPPNGWWYDSYVDVMLTAQPVAGFVFTYWDVDGISQGNGVDVITVNMNTFHVATAHYTPIYNLVIETTAGGTTDPSPGTYSYSSGSTPEVKATSENGYVFHHWELDAVNVGSGNPYLVLMDADHTLKAVFTSIPVGGEWVQLDKSIFLNPLLECASLMLAVTAAFVFVGRKRRRLD